MKKLLKYTTSNVAFTENNVEINNNWTLELETANFDYAVMAWVIVSFKRRNKLDSQTHDTRTFNLLPISFCFCKIGSQSYPDNSITRDYNYHEPDNEIETPSKTLTQTLTMKPLIDRQKVMTY